MYQFKMSDPSLSESARNYARAAGHHGAAAEVIAEREARRILAETEDSASAILTTHPRLGGTALWGDTAEALAESLARFIASADPAEVMFVGMVVWLGVQAVAGALAPVAISRFGVADHALWVAAPRPANTRNRDTFISLTLAAKPPLSSKTAQTARAALDVAPTARPAPSPAAVVPLLLSAVEAVSTTHLRQRSSV